MDNQTKEVNKLKKVTFNVCPETHLININDTFKNAERTGDDKAAVGKSWKEYWQIFTEEDYPTTCPFCGEPLSENDIDGCHISIQGYLETIWLDTKYIIPGHHDCNMQQGDKFIAKIKINAVEAIEK